MAPDKTSPETLMLFDGICNFCNGSVRFVLKRSAGRDLRFCAMQTEPGQSLLKKIHMPAADFETMVVLDRRRVLIKSDAVLRLAECMHAPWPSIAAVLRLVPRRWRDRGYDWVASHRYQIWGRKTQCMVPDPQVRNRFVLDTGELREIT
ncbi:MAG TPA: DCC1-like thiol-disulfide oxidoreductase family protein [Alphaproteobacteria bacterium]